MQKQKNILIVGASYLQLPAFFACKSMNYNIATVDYNKDAVGKRYADKFYHVSTTDEKGIYDAATDFNADAIITLATDMPIRAVAYACEKLGLNSISYETAVNSTDKYKMLIKFQENNVPHPWFYKVSNIDEVNKIQNKIDFPCVCKPIDSSGSRGVVLINNFEELLGGVQYSLSYSKEKSVLIQEYLIGNEVSVEVMVDKDEIYILTITDKITTGPPHFVELGHSQPSLLDDITKNKINNVAKNAIKALGINTGPVHVEIMVTDNGPKIIELGARMGGDFISTHLVPNSTGIDYMEKVIKSACNEDINLSKNHSIKSQYSCAIKYFVSESKEESVIKKIDGIEKINITNDIIEFKLLKNIGDKIGMLSNSHDRIGYVIAKGKNTEEALKNCDNVLNNIKIIT